MGPGLGEFHAGRSCKTHWEQYCAGSEAALAGPTVRNGLARTILVGESDAETTDYLANEKPSIGWYYAYLRDNLATYKAGVCQNTESYQGFGFTGPDTAFFCSQDAACRGSRRYRKVPLQHGVMLGK